jgi:hypothetical protein
VIALADALRAEIPRLAFAVVGMGAPGDLPAWIDDRRATAVDEPREREWCALYAASHLAIGIHGSNMLLPSAHAGAVLELVPRDRWGNYLQDLLIRHADPREAMIHCRLIPEHAPVDEVAAVAVSMLRDRNAAMLNLSRRLSRHADAAGTDFVELRLGLGRSARDGGEESR